MSDWTWNYRVIETDEGWGIFEVYYENGQQIATTQSPLFGYYDSREELWDDVQNIVNAFFVS